MNKRTLKHDFCMLSRAIYKTIQFIDPGPVKASSSFSFDPGTDEGHAHAKASVGENRLFGIRVERRNGRIVFVE